MMREVHLIGNAHIDPVWLWRWQEGFAEIKATFRSALDRMLEEPDFIFTCGCASYYEWVERNAPPMFAEIQRRVAEGRWRIVNGWWLQPDCNVPSGEAFARHALYAQRYFMEKFGKIATVGYNVDSFGHNGNLPQLLKLGGMHAYVMMRPEQHEKDLPPVFLWEGNDGTQMPTAKILNGYVLSNDPIELERRMKDMLEKSREIGLPVMLFYGVGNHGGGPTVSQMLWIKELGEKLGSGHFLYSDPAAYFDEIPKDAKLPVVHDDLQHHASGCYSTTAEVKRLNRLAENRLYMAESFLTAAREKLGYPYAQEEIRRSWKDVLFNHFHDIMGGCSIREAYEDVREWYGESLTISGKLLNEALQSISWAIDTMGDRQFHLTKEFNSRTWEQQQGGVPIVVFNPNAWEVAAPVELSYMQKSLTDHLGQPVPLQTVRASRTNGATDKYNSLFLAKLPAFGYRVFYGFSQLGEETPAAPKAELDIGNDYISNSFLKVEFDTHRGIVRRMTDRITGRQVFDGRGGCIPVVVEDTRTDTWAHGVFSFRDDIGTFGDAQVTVLERGPLRATLRVRSCYGKSTLVQDFSLYRGMEGLFVHVWLNWQEEWKMLKLSFPANTGEAIATYEIPYGLIERPANGEEEPGHAYVDIGDKEQGLTLVNTAKYSYDALKNDLRMTVVRSALYADHYGHRDGLGEHMDIGVQRFQYALLPRFGAFSPSVAARAAAELNMPPISLFESYHKGALPLEDSFASVSADNILLRALKRAEADDGYVARLYETDGVATKAVLHLPLLERQIDISLSPYQILSLHIADDGAVKIVNFMEWQSD